MKKKEIILEIESIIDLYGDVSTHEIYKRNTIFNFIKGDPNPCKLADCFCSNYISKIRYENDEFFELTIPYKELPKRVLNNIMVVLSQYENKCNISDYY